VRTTTICSESDSRNISNFCVLSSFIIPFHKDLDFFDRRSCCEIDSSQKGPEPARIGHIYIFLLDRSR
jgi:hypothetical protein